jgi:hypothetical protein
MQSAVRLGSLAVIFALVGKFLIGGLDAKQMRRQEQSPVYSVSPEGDRFQELDRLRESVLPSNEPDIGPADPNKSDEAQLRQQPEFKQAVPLRSLESMSEAGIDPNTFVTEVSPELADDRLRLEGLPLSRAEINPFLGTPETLSLLRSTLSEASRGESKIITSLERPPSATFDQPYSYVIAEPLSTRPAASPTPVASPLIKVEEMSTFQNNVKQMVQDTEQDGWLRVHKGTFIPPEKDHFMEAVLIAQRKGSEYNTCSGVMLTSRLVVSAAHCYCMISDPEEIFVIFGSSLLFERKRISVDMAKSHSMVDCSEYSRNVARVIPEGDVALYWLAEPVDDVAVRRIAPAEMIFAAAQVRAVGWGSTERVGAEPAKFMADIQIASYDCSELLGEAAREGGCRAQHEMIAAGVRDTCGGDSGGPVYVMAQYEDIWHLAGVTSRAYDPNRGCGGGGIYVKLASPPIIEWLKKNGVPDEIFASGI